MKRFSFLAPPHFVTVLIGMLLVLVLCAFSRAEAQTGTFKGEYFNDPNLNPNFRSTYTSNDGQIDFTWGTDGPNPISGSGFMNSTNYSVSWTGWIDCPVAGDYYFETLSDDGARLYLDNSLTPVINDWGGHSATKSGITIYSMPQGAHRIKLEYFQGPAPFARISLSWRTPLNSTLTLVRATTAPSKIWTPDTGATGGDWVQPSGAGATTGTDANPIYLDEGAPLLLELSALSDVDKWTQGAVETGVEADRVNVLWNVTAGTWRYADVNFGPPWKASYAAPQLAEGETFRAVTITATVYDSRSVPTGDTGSRTDISPPIVKTLKVIVRQHVWSKATGIGVASTDGTKKDGRLLLPVDTRGGAVRPVYAAPDGIVPCSIEAATDLDQVIYYPDTTFDNTPIPDANYVWTTTKGTFRVQNADKTYSYPASVTGKKAYFVAPPATNGQSATATVTCTVSDLLTVQKPDSGDRTDAPLVRTQDIIVPANALNLGVWIYSAPALADGSHPAQFAPVNAPVGGTAYPTILLTVGQGMRVASGVGTVQLQELPDTTNGVSHPDGQNHVDFNLNFADAWNWEKLFDPDGAGPKQLDWWPSPEAPQNAASANGPVQYRFRITWDTTKPVPGASPGASMLLGHNGLHRMWWSATDWNPQILSLAFTSAYGGAYKTITSGDQYVQVSNTTLTNVSTSNGTSDYFKFYSESDNATLRQPTISFTIADQGDPHKYNWKVRVRGTDQDEDPIGVLVRGTASGPGRITVKINDPSASGQTQEGYDTTHYEGNGAYTVITDYGTYTFDISVQEVDDWGNNVDEMQSYRSTKAYLPYYFKDANGQPVRGHSGNIVMGADGIERYFVSYFIQDSSASAGSSATKFGVQMLPPGMLAPVASSDGSWVKTLNTPVKDKLLQTFNTPREMGTYIMPFTAVDNHASEYRDHQNKPLLAKNDRLHPNVPELINGAESRNKDRVVSAQQVTQNGTVIKLSDNGGQKLLSILTEGKDGEAVPYHFRITVRPKVGHTGSARLVHPVADANKKFVLDSNGLPIPNTSNMSQTYIEMVLTQPQIDAEKAKIVGTNKFLAATKRPFFIFGREASTEWRDMELVLSDVGKTTPLINFSTNGGELKPSWDFTVFWVEAKAYVSGNIDSVLPSSVKSGGGVGLGILDDPGQDTLSGAYQARSGANTLGFSDRQNIPFKGLGGPRLIGGIAFSGQIRPSGMSANDFNIAHSRFNSFNWGRKFDVRQYDEKGDLRSSGTGILEVASDNRDDDSNDDDEDLIPDPDGKPNELFIWAIDAPFISWATVANSGATTLSKRFFFRQFAQYAGVNVSKTVSWYWRVSGRAEVFINNAGQQVRILTPSNDIAGDNQLNATDLATLGGSAYDPKLITANLQDSTTPNVSLDSANPVTPTSLSLAQGITPGSIKGANLVMVTTPPSVLAYLIAEYEKDTGTEISIIVFDPKTLQPDGSGVSGEFVLQGAKTSARLHTLKVFNKDKVAAKKDAVLVTP